MLEQRLQKLPHLPASRIRRIVVDREHTNKAKTSTTDNVRLTRQGVVAIDARVGASGNNGAIAEKTSGRIVDGSVNFSAASHARLDERRVDAIGVFEGCDFRIIYADTAEG